MKDKNINIEIVAPKGFMPCYSTLDAAGADIKAYIDEPLTLNPHCRVLVSTGLFMAIPRGFEGQVRPRSGLAAKNGITVLNSPGTIDADYRGEVKIILINHSQEPFIINRGDRIAQLVIAPVIQASFCPSDMEDLNSTNRSAGGFGSTGV